MVKGAGKYVPVDPFVEQRVQVERDMEKLIKVTYLTHIHTHISSSIIFFLGH